MSLDAQMPEKVSSPEAGPPVGAQVAPRERQLVADTVLDIVDGNSAVVSGWEQTGRTSNVKKWAKRTSVRGESLRDIERGLIADNFHAVSEMCRNLTSETENRNLLSHTLGYSFLEEAAKKFDPEVDGDSFLQFALTHVRTHVVDVLDTVDDIVSTHSHKGVTQNHAILALWAVRNQELQTTPERAANFDTWARNCDLEGDNHEDLLTLVATYQARLVINHFNDAYVARCRGPSEDCLVLQAGMREMTARIATFNPTDSAQDVTV